MKLDLSEIAANLGKRIKYEINEEPITDAASGLKCVEPITGSVAFTNTGSTIDMRGKFRTTVELECARCLRSYKAPVEMPIEEELPLEGAPWVHDQEEEDIEELPEDEKEPLFVDNIFDMAEYLRQSIVVSLPIKPLCEEACKGLCSRCGANLNEGPCECPPEAEETPFAALRSLVEEDEGKLEG